MKTALQIVLLTFLLQPNGHDHTGMVKVPGGEFRPFLLPGTASGKITVRSFYLDIHDVTNSEFLQFVKANPQWERSRVPRTFADSNYLKQWAGALEIGNDRIMNSPVTNISWFAASAYCKWKGKRLPTMDEWEFAAGAAPVNAREGEDLSRIILEWYDHPNPAVLPAVMSTYRNRLGLYDMHGLVWEWVEDFNSVMLGSGSQGAGSNSFSCGGGSAGTSNKEDYAAYMRYAFRQSLQAAYTVQSLGFRCAQDVTTN